MKGITVTLINLVESGTDELGNPVYEEQETTVDNVLVAPATEDDVVSSTQLYGKQAIYTIAIPKGDTHTWQDQKVCFFDETWQIFGYPRTGIDDLIPLAWNTQWKVERYG